MRLTLGNVFGLGGKIALVTGGGRGLGKSIAQGFLSAGALKVYIASRDMAALEETAKELSPEGSRSGSPDTCIAGDGPDYWASSTSGEIRLRPGPLRRDLHGSGSDKRQQPHRPFCR